MGGWGLTEKEVGSDATNLTTTVKLSGDHYILNGNKRWIGNGNKDILVVFAKNIDNGNKIEGFIVDMKS
jgi:alkylation response protein AidB-like acyl-CoA dehydrogenase